MVDNTVSVVDNTVSVVAVVTVTSFPLGMKETVDLLAVELRKGFTSQPKYGECCVAKQHSLFLFFVLVSFLWPITECGRVYRAALSFCFV